MSKRYQKRCQGNRTIKTQNQILIENFLGIEIYSENTREHIIANAAPRSNEEELFIRKYKEYYEKWKNAVVHSGFGLPTFGLSVSSLRDELDYWDSNPMANAIYQRELQKKR